MLLYGLNPRVAKAMRTVGLVLVTWSVFGARHHPSGSGRGLVVTISLAACLACWLAWTIHPDIEQRGVTPDLYGLAAAGGVLLGASPNSAASAFVFVAVFAAGLRVELTRALPLLGVGILAAAVSVLVYDDSGLGLLAYALGFAAAALAASNRRQAIVRAEQAELLLAQTQRSQEEQLRAARLEESTRIARDIHDLLAHTLAGLTIQLEATSLLLQRGADRDTIGTRVQRAHALARQGLEETRRAVGALRGGPVNAPAGIEALVADYRASTDGAAGLTIDGDPLRLTGQTGEAVLRVVQEALTNVRKHAPGAGVSVAVHAGRDPGDQVVVRVDDRPPGDRAAPLHDGLATSGGGYGLQGMRERAQLLGGTPRGGAAGEGWRVELHLPAPPDAAVSAREQR